MGSIRGSVSWLRLTTLVLATLLASGCALLSGRTDEAATAGTPPDERSYGILQDGSYLLRHPDGWRFVAVDPKASRGIVLFGTDPEGTLEYAVEQTDFESDISDEEIESLYLDELERLGAEYEVLYLDSNLDVIPAVLVEHGGTRMIAVLLVSDRRVTFATLSGAGDALALDEATARTVLAGITPVSDPTITRINADPPHLHAPDGRWRWVADTPRGITVTGRILGTAVDVHAGVAAGWGASGSTARDAGDGRLFYTGAAVYRARVAAAEERLVTIALEGDDHAYEIEIRPTSASAPALPDADSILTSSTFRELIGIYLILDEGEVPR